MKFKHNVLQEVVKDAYSHGWYIGTVKDSYPIATRRRIKKEFTKIKKLIK